MASKPQLKALKGWKYRLILCDDEGDFTFDDYGYEATVKAGIELLFKDLAKVKVKKEAMKERIGRL